MKDQDKTKRQLIGELVQLRQRIAELESLGAVRGQEEDLLKRDREAPETVTPGRRPERKRTTRALELEIERREHTMRQLQESSELLEGIFSNIHFLVAYMDSDFNFLRVNKTYAMAGGHPPEFFIGKNHFDLYPHEENEAIFRRVVETGEAYHTFAKAFTYPEHPGRGVTFWDWSLLPVRDPDGKAGGVILTLVDVTRTKHTEEELREAKTLLERTFEALDEMVFVVGAADRKVIACNSAVERIFGYTREEVLGRNTEFLHVDKATYDEFGRKISPALDREGVYRGEFELKRKDGTVFPSEHTLREVVDDSGHRTALVSVVRDITERKRYEAELRGYIKRLEQSNKELEDFAYVASHDLQEPLRKIQTFGDRLISKFADSLDHTGRDYLERMLNASKRMQALIDGLLNYSRVTTKGGPFTAVNMDEVIQTVLSNLETRIEETGGTVEVGGLPSIEADLHQMLQLIQNLIGNALKFHRKGVPPKVRICGRVTRSPQKGRDKGAPNKRMCEITVEDNGVGFHQKYTDRIFAPFHRLHGRSEYEGVGMGLAICRKIIERHGGSITAKSTPGLGSVFIVTLPIKHLKETS